MLEPCHFLSLSISFLSASSVLLTVSSSLSVGNWASFLKPSQIQTAFGNNFVFVLDTKVFKGASQTVIRVKMQI